MDAGEPLQVDEDQELFAELERDPERAWPRLVERHAGSVWRKARALGLTHEDCEEVFQGTWIALHRNLDRIRDPVALGAWIGVTVRREALLIQRRRQRRQDVEAAAGDQPSPPASCSTPESEALDRERAEVLRAAVAGLDERCRRLLAALYLDGPGAPQRQLARRLGMPAGSLGPTRRRCLDRLAARLREGDL